MIRIFVVIFVGLVALAGCSQIQHSTALEQSSGSRGVAGVGDVVARVDRLRDLQNAFGRADLFGRKTNEGYSELRYAGLGPNGDVILYRAYVNIVTNETTMSRTPFSSTYTTGSGQAHGSVYGNQYSAYGSGNSISTTISPASDYHAVVPAGAISIDVPRNSPEVVFEGHRVIIEAATPTALTYRIAD
jgi:hypothetical protein